MEDQQCRRSYMAVSRLGQAEDGHFLTGDGEIEMGQQEQMDLPGHMHGAVQMTIVETCVEEIQRANFVSANPPVSCEMEMGHEKPAQSGDVRRGDVWKG